LTSAIENGGMFNSSMNRSKEEFLKRTKILAIILVVSDITILSIGLPVFLPQINCPNIIRIYFLFDMLLTVLKVFLIFTDYRTSRLRLVHVARLVASQIHDDCLESTMKRLIDDK
jgi:hypothetical protein